MAPTIDRERALLLAAQQASLLVSAGALPEELADSELDPEPTEVFDVNGEVLFHRTRLHGKQPGWLDVAADSRVGALLMASAQGAEWEPERLLERAHEALREQQLDDGFDQMRFVAYSYPKLGVQFLAGDKELALLELFTWVPVPQEAGKEGSENFSRWSYLDSLRRSAEKRIARFDSEIETISRLADELGLFDRRILVIDVSKYIRLSISRDLHYSTRSADHSVCFELRGQETNVWCVGASVQMLLDFYRYGYTQVRLAQELGLGTLANPNGLPYANDTLVVTVLENLTSNALNATMYTTNPFSRFRTEINANRPLISFIPGHSRTVAGYTDTSWIFGTGFQGLLVYDPWPPNAGVITRWENFNASTYRRTFTARVTLV